MRSGAQTAVTLPRDIIAGQTTWAAAQDTGLSATLVRASLRLKRVDAFPFPQLFGFNRLAESGSPPIKHVLFSCPPEVVRPAGNETGTAPASPFSSQEVPHLAQFANLYPQFRFASYDR